MARVIEPELCGPQHVSIVIPAYNRSDSIRRTIASVPGDYGGSYEVIVVDDGSTDMTCAVAQEAIDQISNGRGRVLCQSNAGPGAARNIGAGAAEGAYLAFLDSDDRWFPNTLSSLSAALADLSQVGSDPALIFLQTVDTLEGQLPTGSEGGQIEMHAFKGFLESVEAFPRTRYGSCNVVLRKDIFEALGGFTELVRCSEDTDLFLRAAAFGPCVVLSGIPLVEHVKGRRDQLTDKFDLTLEGFKFMIQQERAGHYPEMDSSLRLKDRMLAKCAIYTTRKALAAGRVDVACKLYLQCLPRLWRARNWRGLIGLPLSSFSNIFAR